MAKNSSAVVRLRQTCCLGLPSTVLMPQILQEMHRIVPADRFHFAWSDPLGNIMNGYFEKPDARALDYFQKHHQQFEEETGLVHRQVLLFGKTTGNFRWPIRRGFESTQSHRELFANLGLRYCLDGVVRDACGPLGMIYALRRTTDPDFSAQDEARLAQTLPYIAHAIARPSAAPRSFVESGDSALIVFDARGRPSFQSARARELCLYALAYVDNAEHWEAGLGLKDAEAAMARLFEQVRRGFERSELASGPPAWNISNQWGEFQVRAYRSSQADGAPSSFGVLLEQKTPIELRILQRVKDMPLSARQREVCFLIARGLALADIARMMCIAPTTLKAHTQTIYRKLGIRNREELTALVAAV